MGQVSSVPSSNISAAHSELSRIHRRNRDRDRNAQQTAESSIGADGDIDSHPHPSRPSVPVYAVDGALTGGRPQPALPFAQFQTPKNARPLSKLTHERIMSAINGSTDTPAKPFSTPKHGFTIFKSDNFDLVLAVDYNARGTRLVTASADHKIRVYDLNEEGSLCHIDGWTAHDASISAVSHHYSGIRVLG